MSPDVKNQVQQMKASLDQLERLVDGDVAQEAPKEDLGPEDVENVVRMLKNMAGTTVSMEKTEGKTEDEKTEEEKAAEEEAKKSIKKSDEGTHADDTAEEVVEDVPPVTEENIKDVAKALIMAMKSQKKSIQKSQHSDVVTIMPRIVDVIKSQNERIDSLEKGIENILSGIGVAEKVKEIYKSEFEKSRENEINKANSPDWQSIQKSIEDFKAIMKGGSPIEKENKGVGWGFDSLSSQPNAVRKSIADTLSGNLTKRG